jgi:hypothetical protein
LQAGKSTRSPCEAKKTGKPGEQVKAAVKKVGTSDMQRLAASIF